MAKKSAPKKKSSKAPPRGGRNAMPPMPGLAGTMPGRKAPPKRRPKIPTLGGGLGGLGASGAQGMMP